MTHTILLIDDEPKLRDALSVALADMGYRVLAAADGAKGIELLDQEMVDSVLTDLKMPGMSGHQLLVEINRRESAPPVVIMTAYSSVKDAVQIIKEGAFDYLAKPIDMDHLETTLRNAVALHDARQTSRRLIAEMESRFGYEEAIGKSPAFRKVQTAIAEVGNSKANVLLLGESGTGKEMAARAIHFVGTRREEPFVAVNCASIPEGLLESELFGHVKGAFTGAVNARAGRFFRADRGTLFLDEIADMPLALQAKILRVLQERKIQPVGSDKEIPVDVRIIAATNRDLRAEVSAKRFREDLLFRLNVFAIELPPLRERGDDIRLLALHFMRIYAIEMKKRLDGFSADAIKAMAAYDWPGNIRELQNCVERAVIVCKASVVDARDLPAHLGSPSSSSPISTFKPPLPVSLDDELQKLERSYLQEALEKAGGVQKKAAELLAISERSFWHRLKKAGLSVVKSVVKGT